MKLNTVDMTDDIIAFTGGDLLVMFAVWLHIFHGVFGYGVHLFVIASYGFIGGFAGLVGKIAFYKLEKYMAVKYPNFFKRIK